MSMKKVNQSKCAQIVQKKKANILFKLTKKSAATIAHAALFF